MGRRLSSEAIDRALNRLRAGEMIIVVDDPGREDEGDLVMAAEYATPERLAFMVRHTTGIVCAPMGQATADALELPMMVALNVDPHMTAFTVSVDAVNAGTGVSASDRSCTLRALAGEETRPSDLRRPRHIFPLRAHAGGVHERGGHTEAAVDLLRLAGLTEVGVISEIVAPSGAMMRGTELSQFGAEHNFPIVSVAELKDHLSNSLKARVLPPTQVELKGTADLPTTFGHFTAHAYSSVESDNEHLVLTTGNITEAAHRKDGLLVRVHSECITGDMAGSLRCDCGGQFRDSLDLIAKQGAGALIYLRGHEGRGIGLGHKLRAYALQEHGRDTVDANLDLGLPVDARDYSTAAGILKHLGIERIALITNNPIKHDALVNFGVEVVRRISLASRATPENVSYMRTKRDRMGHLLEIQNEKSGAGKLSMTEQY